MSGLRHFLDPGSPFPDSCFRGNWELNPASRSQKVQAEVQPAGGLTGAEAGGRVLPRLSPCLGVGEWEVPSPEALRISFAASPLFHTFHLTFTSVLPQSYLSFQMYPSCFFTWTVNFIQSDSSSSSLRLSSWCLT